jgi:L-amino acid N-acyltransferase YncA
MGYTMPQDPALPPHFSPLTSRRPHIRPAEYHDLPSITAIYGHHVAHGFASFEETPPALEQMTLRFETVKTHGLPYLVATTPIDPPYIYEEKIVGYAYAGHFRPQAAFAKVVEDSIYVAPGHEGQGIGRLMLRHLLESLGQMAQYRHIIAVTGVVDGYSASVKLHQSLGFSTAVELPGLGFKFGRWVDIVMMSRPI